MASMTDFLVKLLTHSIDYKVNQSDKTEILFFQCFENIYKAQKVNKKVTSKM